MMGSFSFIGAVDLSTPPLDLLLKNRQAYPFLASWSGEVDKSVSLSAVLQRGTRVYAFKTHADREAFLSTHEGAVVVTWVQLNSNTLAGHVR